MIVWFWVYVMMMIVIAVGFIAYAVKIDASENYEVITYMIIGCVVGSAGMLSEGTRWVCKLI